MLPIFQFRSQPKKSLAAIAIGCLVLFIISGVSTTRLLAISPDPEAVIRVVPGEMREDEFDVDFRLDTGGTAISGIHVHVTHSPNLELKQGSAEGSMFSQSVLEPEETKSDGSFEFVRLRFDEGFAGEDGQLLHVTFRILTGGETFISVDAEKSMVVAFENVENILKRTEGVQAILPDPSSSQPASPLIEGSDGSPPPDTAWNEVTEERPAANEELVQEEDEESVVPSTNGESTAPEEQRLPIILIVALTGGVAFFMVIAALFAGMVWGLRNSSSPPPQT
ncbi:MAG TPA: hypothetical protein VJB60_01110 [Candidatus Peribacterales bacterium]|nr:hypothetical protein [Candidatus Peribacterales bacterium]